MCLEENLTAFYVCLCQRAKAERPNGPLPEFPELIRNMLLTKHIREHIIERQLSLSADFVLKGLRAALVLVTCCQTSAR